MPSPSNIRLVVFILATAAGGAFAALEKTEPGWKWLGAGVAVAGAIAAGLTRAPGDAKEMARMQKIVNAADRIREKTS